ncbi:glyoxylate/hydroxypyruvate reductase HPR3 [Quillaja saponaria]|uniref:Glyoxylate/hydroxypyruvate reductase HPR3 n=1 Tax=Quillaja saponaria TaxID=32244 RepID=A0AAD7QJC5_QUISA|nr:glyoxylate/hydroxypyruvate reductase HPR3 [Quillaja saponaria]
MPLVPLRSLLSTLAKKTAFPTYRTRNLACTTTPPAAQFVDRADLLEKICNMVTDDEKCTTRVLFCGSQFPASHEYTREYLQSYPFIKVDDVSLDDVPNVIANYHVCIVKMMQLDSNVISRASQMQLIMQYGVGLEGVDIDAATKCGIKVARIPSSATGNSTSCAEMAIYLMLGLLRKQNEMQIAIKQKKLGYPIGETLNGKTVFIVGYGNIGIDLAKRLRPFGVKIIATKRSWPSYSQDNCKVCTDDFDLVDEKGNHEDIHDFACKADIVVCCLSLNSQTAGIINKQFISLMKKGALLVNIARGGLLDYEAVAYNLESGHLGGLGIDVAWTEPFDPTDPILKFKNVIITPHVAGVTEQSYRSMAKVVGDVLLQLHAGSPLTGIEFVN